MNTTLFRLGSACLAAGAVASVWLLTSCREQEAAMPMPPDAVAVVGHNAITRDTFVSKLTHRSGPKPARSDASQMKEELLGELIRFEVLYQRALAAGYDQDPEITSNLKRMIATKFLEDQLATLGPPQVSTADIDAYYRNNPDRFGTPEQIRIALIEIKVPRTAPPDKRAEFGQKASTILAEARTNRPPDGTFGLLAQRHSEDQASRYRGGDIGWLTVGNTQAPWDSGVLTAAFQLAEPGEIAPVVETPTAFYLLKLMDRRPASVRPLEEVRDGIKYLVTRQREAERLRAFHHSLQHGLFIQTNHALLDSIQPPTNQQGPPDMPGSLSATARTP